VDAVGPALALVDPAPGGFARANEIAVTLRVSDPGSGVDPAGLEVSLDGEKLEAALDPAAGTASARAGVADGRHRIEARARDRAGNVSRGAWSFEADGRGPTFFDLGSRSALALRIADFGSGVDPASLQAPAGRAREWDPATGILIFDAAGAAPPGGSAMEPPAISIADRAGNVSAFAPPGTPIADLERLRVEAGKAPKVAPLPAPVPEVAAAPVPEKKAVAPAGESSEKAQQPGKPSAAPEKAPEAEQPAGGPRPGALPLWIWIAGGAGVLILFALFARVSGKKR